MSAVNWTAGYFDEATYAHPCTLELPNSEVAVRSDSRATFEELVSRLAPFVIVSEVRGPPTTPALFARVEPRSRVASLRPPEGLVGDKVVMQSSTVPKYTRTGERHHLGTVELIVNPSHRPAILIKRPARSVAAIGPDPIAVSKEIRRIGRDLYLCDLLTDGFISMHGAAVDIGAGRIVLIAGAQRAGKTSLLFEALGSGARFVSNDRVLLRNTTDGGVESRGCPERVLARIGVVANQPRLRHLLPSQFADSDPRRLWGVDDSRKLSIRYRELTRLYDTDVTVGGELVAVVFPSLGNESSEPLRPQPPQAAHAALIEAMRTGDQIAPNWHGLATVNRAAIDARSDQVCKTVASTVPSFRLERPKGGDAAAAWAQFLDALGTHLS